jgi:two-component sensor histidine kinase
LDLYSKKRRWKILLFLFAVVIGVASLVYTQWLSGKMAMEERKKAELRAEVSKRLGYSFLDENGSGTEQLTTLYYSLLDTIIAQNNTIPIIVADSLDRIIFDVNIKYSDARKDNILGKELEKMKSHSAPIEIDLGDGNKQYMYFRESYLLRNLRYFPLIQMFVVFLFIGVAYMAFSASRKAEQNQVWVGMSKETAHQLGTPISALMAWLEILKMKDIDQGLIDEFEKDIQRLEKITERFSKIGSAPELTDTNVCTVINSTINYLKVRFSNRVKFETNFDDNTVFDVPLNAALFSWVIENLCKNAIDAMDNHGKISISIKPKDNNLFIDVSDTGKGIAKSQFKTIFQPGYSTKKRGWGLGLSLAKRIVEIYHKGKIFIKSSELNKGTTFRIILKRSTGT